MKTPVRCANSHRHDRTVRSCPVRSAYRVRPPESRFLKKFHALPSGCWEWVGTKTANGYGLFCLTPAHKTYVTVLAHRWAYEHFVGPIPGGLQLDHLCRNRACVNPAHLEPVTPAENTHRGDSIAARNALKTHCNHGHPFSGDNLLINKQGFRVCRACRNAKHLRWYYRKQMERGKQHG